MLSQQGLNCEYWPGKSKKWLWLIIRYFEVEKRRVKAKLYTAFWYMLKNVKANEAAYVCHPQHIHHCLQDRDEDLKE